MTAPGGNFVYRLTKTPQIHADMLMERSTTETPRPYLNGVTPPTDGPFVWSRTGTVALDPWPQGSVIQMASGL